MGFFLEKGQRYQRWLDTTGLGSSLQVEKVRFQRNLQTGKPDFKQLELILLLRTNDVDSAVGLWHRTQKDFERTANGPLMEELFRTFAYKMEIPAAQGNVQIYVNGSNGRKIPCFFVWIWEEEGHLKDSVRVNACKAQSFDITMPPVKVRKVVRGSTMVSKNIKTADEVFDLIMAFAQAEFPSNKYAGGRCNGRFPSIVVENRTETQLIFSVSDLCREALTNADYSIWCDIAIKTGWNKDCNDIKRERLTFTFDYLKNGAEGYRLKCQLVGKFGSGVYVPRTSGYMDMDPDFLSFEKDFAIKFKNKLEPHLR